MRELKVGAWTLVGVALLVLSVLIYFLYQALYSLPVGLSSILLFGVGFYLSLREVRLLDPFRSVLPFIISGAAISVALVTFGLNAYITGSAYGSALAYASVRLTAFLFSLRGVSVTVSSQVLSFPDGRAIAVTPLCSGGYTAILFILLSFVMVADLGRKAPKKRLAIALAIGILGANLANMFRIVFLASVLYSFGLSEMEVVHEFAGYVVFLTFMTLFWLLSLRYLRITPPGNPPQALA